MYYLKFKPIPSQITFITISLLLYFVLTFLGMNFWFAFGLYLAVVAIWWMANRSRFARMAQSLKTHVAIADYCDAEIQRSPKDAELYNVRGVAHLRLHNFEQADQDFEKAIDLAPGFAWAYSNQVYGLIKQGRYDEALNRCEAAMDRAKKPAEMMYVFILRGECYGLMGDLDEALADVNRAFQDKIKRKVRADIGAILFPWLFTVRGKIHLMQGEVEQAAEDFQSALDIKPNLKAAQAALAVAYHRQGNIQEATTLWQSLIEDKADYGDMAWVRVEMDWPDAMFDTAREIIAAL
jgi:tetratricopeptide (TPR) repeat protein